jgi:hypothetical protein
MLLAANFANRIAKSSRPEFPATGLPFLSRVWHFKQPSRANGEVGAGGPE